MINLKKPIFVFSLAVLSTQVAWAEVAKEPPVTTGMTILLDASDLNADGIVDPGSHHVDDNNGVALWQNRSTLNGGRATADNNFFSIAESKKPKWVRGALNDKAVIRFKDGGFKNSSVTQIPANSNYTKFVIFKINDTAVPNNLISSDSNALWMGEAVDTKNEKKGVLKAWHKPSNYLIDKNNKVIDTQDYHTAVTRYAHGVPITPTLSNVLRLDGAELAFNNLSKPFAGSATYIGVGNLENEFPLSGEIAEVIVYNRALSDAEITQVEQYLKDKWGGLKAQEITLTLDDKGKKEVGSQISLKAESTSKLTVELDTVKSKANPESSTAICSLKLDGKGAIKVVLNAVGKCVIQADQSGDKDYRAADTVFLAPFDVVAVQKPTKPTTTPKKGGGGSSEPIWLMLFGLVATLSFRRKKRG